MKYQKSQYPIGADGLYQAIVHDEANHKLYEGVLQGVVFTSAKFGKTTKFDLSNAQEVAGLFQLWDDLDAHDKKMQEWRDDGE